VRIGDGLDGTGLRGTDPERQGHPGLLGGAICQLACGQWEVRYERDSQSFALREYGRTRPVGEVEPVLHRGDRGDSLCLGQTGGIDAAEPEMPDHAFVPQIGQRTERVGQRYAIRRKQTVAAHPQVHQVELLEAKPAQVLGDLAGQLLRPAGRYPLACLAAEHADLGRDHQVRRIWVQRLAKQVVGDMGPIEVAGVDVGDAQFDRAPQHLDGGLPVVGRPPHAWAG
jgi:hypothetical protein